MENELARSSEGMKCAITLWMVDREADQYGREPGIERDGGKNLDENQASRHP